MRDQVIPAIKQQLFEHGIEIAYPTHQVLFHDQTEEVDGDRRHQRAGWPAGKGDVPRPRRITDALSRLADMSAQVNGDGRSTVSSSRTE